MKAKTLFIFIIVLLVAANGFVFFNIRQKHNKLGRAHQLLVNDTTLAKHLRYVWRIQKSDLRSMYAPGDNQVPYEACMAALSLMSAIDDLERFSKQVTYANPRDYFSASVTVDAALRDSLYVSYARLDARMRKWYPDTLSESFYHISKRARASYQAMLTKLKTAPPGRPQQFVFQLEMPGESPFRLDVTATMTSDGIVWNDTGIRIPVFLQNLDLFTYRLHLGIHEKLGVLKQTLGERNKVNVFNETFDLGALSPAQLRVVVNHLKLTQAAMNAQVLQPLNFYSDEE